MNLIQSFAKGNVPGFNQPPDKTIETLISHLFFFSDTVVKIYKKQKFFFADLKEPSSRHQFYLDDFRWNHKMSPSIYPHLQGTLLQAGLWQPSLRAKAQDFYLVMKRIDDTKNLTKLLLSDQITERHLADMTDEMIIKIKELGQENKTALRRLQNNWTWPQFHSLDTQDNKSWAYSAAPLLPKKITDGITSQLTQTCQRLPYFQNMTMDKLDFAIDSQSDNILIFDNAIEFLDIMPPKNSWRIQDLFFTISRPATDVSVLSSPAQAEAIYQTYAKHFPLPPPSIKTVYEIKSALIKTAYLYILHQPKLARQYLAYINRLLPQLP